MKKEDIKKMIKMISENKCRSYWDRGVNDYVLEIMEDAKLEEGNIKNVAELETMCLNGASDWGEYSWGGCSLIYDSDIAKRLCTPSELKRKHDGELPPNSREQWLDTQARALYQAFLRIKRAYRKVKEEE